MGAQPRSQFRDYSVRKSEHGERRSGSAISMSDLVESVVDLNERVLSALGMLRNSLSERIALSAILAVPLGAIRVDAGAVQTAILHLVDIFHNATPNEGGLVLETESICFEVGEDCDKLGLMPGEYVCLSVSGTTRESSSSLPPEYSTALRLAPVYAFAKRNGGTATIRNGSDKDTTVSVYLPRASSDPSSIPIKDETDELRVDLLRRSWQGVSHATPSAPLAEDSASPGLVAGRWFSPKTSARFFRALRADHDEDQGANLGGNLVNWGSNLAREKKFQC